MTSNTGRLRLPVRLRPRIVATTAAGTLLAMLVLSTLMQLLLSAAVSGQVRLTLVSRAQAAQDTLAVRNGRLVSLGGQVGILDQNAWVIDRSGRVVEGTLRDDDTASAARALAGTDIQRIVDVGESTRLLALPTRVRQAGTPAGTVVVGVDLRPFERIETYALVISIVLGVFVVLGTTAVAWWTVRRSLRPVDQMARAASGWSEHDLDRRFGLGPPRDEITTLAETLDSLLGRVATALRAEQRLSNEMAHELRTPLTAVSAEAELALRSADDASVDRERWARVLSAAETMSSAVTALMQMAREAATPGGAVAVALGAVLDGALAARPADPGGDLARGRDETTEAVAVSAPLDLAVRAVVPLLDNAWRHGDGRVEVALDMTEGTGEIHVRNGGAGIGATDPDQLFEPGRRLGSGAGGGLGLALSRRIARSLGGDVTLAGGGDGVHAVLSLPRA